jgi:hypothetical protein
MAFVTLVPAFKKTHQILITKVSQSTLYMEEIINSLAIHAADEEINSYYKTRWFIIATTKLWYWMPPH